MNSQHEVNVAVFAAIKAQPGIARPAIVEAFPGDDVGAALRMLGSCRSIKHVCDRSAGHDGFWTWETAPSLSAAERDGRISSRAARYAAT